MKTKKLPNIKDKIKLFNNSKKNIINKEKKTKKLVDPKISFKYKNDLIRDGQTSAINEFNCDFCIFKSSDDIIYLIYANKNKSIVAYNIIDNKKMFEIKNPHKNKIICIKYYVDYIKKKNLILSISGSNIKLWDIQTLECLFSIDSTNDAENILGTYGCFLFCNNELYIAVKFSEANEEPIKILDLKGSKVKDINNSNDKAYYIDIYYDKKQNDIYLVAGNDIYIKSYKYNENELYRTYVSNSLTSKSLNYFCFIMNNNSLKLIGSTFKGVFIWNFHFGNLLNYISTSNNQAFYGICLWNNYNFFIGDSKTISQVKIKDDKLKIINGLKAHKNDIVYIKKYNHPIYGICLISQDKAGIIKLWIRNIKNN